MLDILKKQLSYIIIACFMAISGGFVGLHLDNTIVNAQTVQSIGCEDIGCSDSAPECVENDGTYSCVPDPDNNQCSHVRCSDPEEN